MKSLIFIGDSHGEWRYIEHRIKSLHLNDIVFVHVGDFGVGFMKEHLEEDALDRLNNVLKDHNCILYAIRGNHDKPSRFNGTNMRSNLKLLPDYSVITVLEKNILLIGGAISIDRRSRLRDMQQSALYGRDMESYWFDESFKLDRDKLTEIENIDIVVTHSCPKFVDPINNFSNIKGSHGPLVEHFCENDETLKDALNTERKDLATAYEILKWNNKIKTWFYGHFHRSNKETYEETEFIMLNINEFYELK